MQSLTLHQFFPRFVQKRWKTIELGSALWLSLCRLR